MSVLGPFSTQLHGKIAVLRNSLNAHIALTATPHGATVAATASRLVIRDASGRAQVATPSAAGDIATKGYVDSALGSGPQGTVTSITAGTGLSGGTISVSGTINIANTTVVAGTYNFATLTVNSRGQLTAASSGSPVTSVGVSAPITKTGAASTPTLGISAATGAAAGSMSAADKSKLDGIASGAQVNSITSVFGRTGAVAANTGDYTIQKISGVTVSTAAPSGGANGDIWFQVA